MTENQSKKKIFYLADDNEWGDLEDLHPPVPETPKELRPWRLTSQEVHDVGALGVYAYTGSPEFDADSVAVEATPGELERFQAAYAQYEAAQETYRQRAKEAAAAYELAVKAARAGLAEAMQEYRPVEFLLTTRSAELAAILHRHRQAAEEHEKKREEEKQAELDAIHGPRCISLHKPISITSLNRADRIARVHLTSCQRRPKQRVLIMRAEEAWKKLKDPAEFAPSYSGVRRQILVRFCNICKPWMAFEKYIPNFTGLVQTEIELDKWPDKWERPRD
jgi:hypothetical protein